MCFIIRNKLCNIVKNPIYAIGIVVMLAFVYVECSRYLEVRYFTDDSQIITLDESEVGEADVMDGYIPMSEKERFDSGLSELKNDLTYIGLPETEAEEICSEAGRMDMREAIEYLGQKCSFLANVSSYFYKDDAKKGTAEAVNSYIKSALAREDYMDYFGRKFADYLGTVFAFFCLILFPFYFGSDCKKDIYELLHTKPLSGKRYIVSQALGSILAGLLAVAVITLVFQGIVFFRKGSFDFAADTLRIWKYSLWCITPGIVFVSAIFLLASVTFKSPFPAIPPVFLLIIYSNSGVKNVEGSFAYLHRPGSILIRYPELFFETNISDRFYAYQAGLAVVGLLIIMLATVVWEKKRV